MNAPQRKAAPSAKPLFKAIRGKKAKASPLPMLPDALIQEPPSAGRDPLDYDPTPPSATEPFLLAELEHIRAHGNTIWETAVGGGHIAHVLQRYGFDVIGTDVEHRGWPETRLTSFFDHDTALAPIEITNPPYCEINAAQGHGRWFWHGLALGLPYRAMLLSAMWPGARKNGMDKLFQEHPPSIEYLCCWRIDFRGGGSAPMQNSWFVWDQNRPALGPNTWPRVRLYRDIENQEQGVLL